MSKQQRLVAIVAEYRGLSKREAIRCIRTGRVSIDGEVCLDSEAQVCSDAAILLDGERLSPPPRVALLHKPFGVHSTVTDPFGRPCLSTVARELLALGLHPVGRLDAQTDGLLLFSREGRITQHLLHPKRAVPRTYRAIVEGAPSIDLVARLAAGIETTDGTFCAELHTIEGSTLTLTVTEGKHRMVRRMLANAGHPVVALRRLKFGPFSLGELASGCWREATDEELAALL